MSNSQQPAKMWSGRFREPLDRTFEQWQRSFPFDWRLLPHEVAASQAHARALAAAGILTAEELDTMLSGLTRVGERLLNWSHRISATSGQIDYETSNAQVGAAIVASAPQAEDIHHFVELELTKEIGALALKLHTGRSRNEQIATDMRLFVRQSIDTTQSGLVDLDQCTPHPGRGSHRRRHARLHAPPARRARPRRALVVGIRLHARARPLPLRRRPRAHEPLPARQRSHRRSHARPRSQHRGQRARLHRAHAQLHRRDLRPRLHARLRPGRLHARPAHLALR